MRERITYPELKKAMCDFNEKHGLESKGNEKYIVGVVVFTADSFEKEYNETERSFRFTSDNKAFLPNMGGYSIFGGCLDGTDMGIRLEQYIDVEYGAYNKAGRDKTGWHVEYAYIEKVVE